MILLSNEKFENNLKDEGIDYTRDIYGNIRINRDKNGNIIYKENTFFHYGKKLIQTNIGGDRASHSLPRIKVRQYGIDDVIILDINEGELEYNKMEVEYNKRNNKKGGHIDSDVFNYVKGFAIFAHKEIWDNKENHTNQTEMILQDLANDYDNLDNSFRKNLISVANRNINYEEVKPGILMLNKYR